MKNQKILLSACLLGQKVRYDGGSKLYPHDRLQRWFDEGRVITICPEVAGGLSVPRPPAEIEITKIGTDVLKGVAKIKTNQGDDVSHNFIAGAKKTLALAQLHNIRVAILKARSPSCGSIEIYDGTFSGKVVKGMGTTAALLIENGISVFTEDHIDAALDAAQQYF